MSQLAFGFGPRTVRVQATLLDIIMEATGTEQEGSERAAVQATTLVDVADYQEGSVVSRTVLDKKTGTVTFFAFDKGQGLSEHAAPFDALVHILEGEAEIVISGKSLHLKNGEIVLMPANQPHSVHARAKLKMILTMIRS